MLDLSYGRNKFSPSCLLKLTSLVIAFNIGACNCDNTADKVSRDTNSDRKGEKNKAIDLLLNAAGKTSITGMELIQLKIANNGTASTTGRS